MLIDKHLARYAALKLDAIMCGICPGSDLVRSTLAFSLKMFVLEREVTPDYIYSLENILGMHNDDR